MSHTTNSDRPPLRRTHLYVPVSELRLGDIVLLTNSWKLHRWSQTYYTMRKQYRYLNNLKSALYSQGQRRGFTVGLINLGFYGHTDCLPQFQQAGAVFPPVSATSGCWKPQSPHISSTAAVIPWANGFTLHPERAKPFSQVFKVLAHTKSSSYASAWPFP